MSGSRLRKLFSGSAGSEIAEAALVLPLAFMILLGIYWFGRAINVYATVNHAAREGARAAALSTCGSCGNVSATAPANLANVVTTVTTAMQAANLHPGDITPYAPAVPFCANEPNGCNVAASSTSNITVCHGVRLTPLTSPGPPVCGVSVTFQYPFSFSLPFIAPTLGSNAYNLLLKADVQMQGEY